MKISVVLSTYNGEKYIVQQLDSILNQKRVADEVLIFDDCSTDNTVEMVKEFIANHNLRHWKFVENKKNKGWKRNFMEGIWCASGDLIFPCDQDDIWMLDKLEIMEKIMIENPKVEVLTVNYTAFYDSGKKVNGPEANDGKFIRQEMTENFFDTKYPGCTYCIRRDFVELSKKYWETDFPHDALFWRMGILTNTLYSYHKSLILWRKHKDSAYTIESIQTKTMQRKRAWLEYALRVTNRMKSFVKDYNVPNIDRKIKQLERTEDWIYHRQKFYDTGKLIDWIKLIPYLKNYDRLRQYAGDLYLVKLKKI